ncbi:hypothetical protein NEHOM01_2383 [Nematocida homosporus]|uniref:uncharacterized protein n=1 Tax=Nematocida homosporus TaxID=1912981 RepID=UPI00221F7C91|nr:uncharacterized protein NEHOM01_2383 [Nematocida homosporus]KAI5187807.1 hypothetical protein NEHOM01_2383 [Nematocida homosporus]
MLGTDTWHAVRFLDLFKWDLREGYLISSLPRVNRMQNIDAMIRLVYACLIYWLAGMVVLFLLWAVGWQLLKRLYRLYIRYKTVRWQTNQTDTAVWNIYLQANKSFLQASNSPDAKEDTVIVFTESSSPVAPDKKSTPPIITSTPLKPLVPPKPKPTTST